MLILFNLVTPCYGSHIAVHPFQAVEKAAANISAVFKDFPQKNVLSIFSHDILKCIVRKAKPISNVPNSVTVQKYRLRLSDDFSFCKNYLW